MSQELADQIAFHRDCARNWARLTGGPGDPYQARLALIERVAATGVLETTPPAWMTSPKPGIDFYLTVDGVVLLVKDEEAHGRPWHAINATAPRRGSKRRNAPGAQASDPEFTPELQEALAMIESGELAELIRFSVHCMQRAHERGALSEEQDSEALRELVAADGRFGRLPSWANAAGVGNLAVICAGEELAFPVGRDRNRIASEPLALTATTCMPHAWVKATLTELPAQELAEQLTISTRVLRDHDIDEQELRTMIAREGRVSIEVDGAWILCGGRRLRLRPTDDHDHPWLINA